MNTGMILIANSFFLAIILTILIAVSFRSNSSETPRVKEDLKRIKEQILADS